MAAAPALKHGLYARSPSALEIRGRKVARLMRKLRVVAPWLEPSDESTARAYCDLEILSASIFAQLSTMGVTKVTAEGRDLSVRALVDAHRQMKQTQLAYAKELGRRQRRAQRSRRRAIVPRSTLPQLTRRKRVMVAANPTA
jgi:hypothetical protein